MADVSSPIEALGFHRCRARPCRVRAVDMGRPRTRASVLGPARHLRLAILDGH